MGLLTEGEPLPWERTKALAEHVREHGIVQFINLYRRLKSKTGDILKFGDEVSMNKYEYLNPISPVFINPRCLSNFIFRLNMSY